MSLRLCINVITTFPSFHGMHTTPEVSGAADGKCQYSKKDELQIARGRLITMIPKITKEFEVRYELWVTALNTTNWHNIIHLTTNSNRGKYGERIASAWIYRDRLRVHSAVHGNDDFYSEEKIEQVCILANFVHPLQLTFSGRPASCHFLCSYAYSTIIFKVTVQNYIL